MEKGCFSVKYKNGNIAKYPLFENEIGEVVLKSDNAVSTGALASLGFWGIDAVIMTQNLSGLSSISECVKTMLGFRGND